MTDYKLPIRRRPGREEPSVENTITKKYKLTTLKIVSTSSGPDSKKVEGLAWANNRSYGRLVFGSYVLLHSEDHLPEIVLAARLNTDVFEVLSIESGYDPHDPELQHMYGDLRILADSQPHEELSPWGRFKAAIKGTAE